MNTIFASETKLFVNFSHSVCIPYVIKGMLRRNIERFLKSRIYEKLGISEMKLLKKSCFFFQFPTVCIFDFFENMNPRLYILFLVDKFR